MALSFSLDQWHNLVFFVPSWIISISNISYCKNKEFMQRLLLNGRCNFFSWFCYPIFSLFIFHFSVFIIHFSFFIFHFSFFIFHFSFFIFHFYFSIFLYVALYGLIELCGPWTLKILKFQNSKWTSKLKWVS